MVASRNAHSRRSAVSVAYIFNSTPHTCGRRRAPARPPHSVAVLAVGEVADAGEQFSHAACQSSASDHGVRGDLRRNKACAAAEWLRIESWSRAKHPLVFKAAGGLRFQPTGVGM